MARKRNNCQKTKVIINLLSNNRIFLSPESQDSTIAVIAIAVLILLTVLPTHQENGFSFILDLIRILLGW